MFCPRCASEVSITAVRCPNCSQFLGGKPDPAQAVKATKAVTPAPQTVAQTIVKPMETKTASTENSVKNQAEIQTEKCKIPLDNSEEMGYNNANKLHKGEKNMFCPKCGNNVGDNDVFCDKCGQRLNEEVQEVAAAEAVEAAPVADTAVQQPVQPVAPVAPVAAESEGKSNGVAIAALIVSLVGPMFFMILGNIVGLILGIVGVKKSAACGGKGKGMGIASIVISVLGIVVGVGVVVAAIVCLPMLMTWFETNMETMMLML